MAFSKQYLDFEPVEIPASRKRQPKFADYPTISNMVKEIVEYRRQFLQLKTKLSKHLTKNIDLDFLIQFLFNIQTDECIGLQNYGATREIITSLTESWPDVDEQSMLDRLKPKESKQSEEQSSSDSYSQERRQESTGSGGIAHRKREHGGASSDEEGEKRLKYDKSFGAFSPPKHSSTDDTESVIERTHELISKDKELPKQRCETINLYRAYKRLAQEIDKDDKVNRKLCLGLIDMDVLVLKLHKILMDNVMGDKNTKPGQFSTNIRSAEFKGQLHIYPRFATEEIASVAVQRLLDIYADILEEIRKIEDEPVNDETKIIRSFQLASLFLFGFLVLHPFGDGNGRLARLLCSYSLCTFSPFMTPIFNVFCPSEKSDYVDALVEARKGLQLPEVIDRDQEAKDVVAKVFSQKPSDLCSLLIESNNFTWKEYVRRLEALVTAS